MAMAPEQIGIGIRRYFTQPGTHPYDTVAWEQRDARIQNFKDGTDAFFQPDVEFPASWSQNATNIVAQKYFRGTLGLPERETSLREVIDRVADTITAWGMRDGYFVDEQEGAAFRNELKYVLLHQRASFNSPVWFNIGVEGVPAQASACFILAVEDTMDGILNWYREEGIIFKGGSGSGINLSGIRSSQEHLAGGGTASGPVSFMRGADASAGTIKCLHADTPIVTSRGVVPIREARAGDDVATRHGPRRIEGVHDNSVRRLVRVKTSLGDEILCTPEHRFLVRGRDGVVWREAGMLQSDDYLTIDLAADDLGRVQTLRHPSTGHHREIEHDLPDTLDEAFALWLGWIYGDGSITTYDATNVISLQIGDSDPELTNRYSALTRTVFGERAHFCLDRHTDRLDASTSVRLASTRIIRFLELNGLRKGRAHALSVPSLIQGSPLPVRAAFLAGLFEADGHVGNGYPQLSTVSRDLALDVHRLLLSIGIPSKLGRIDDRRDAYGERPVHIVRVVGGEGVRRFAKLVGFISERKQRAIDQALARKNASRFESQWILPHVGEELDCVWRSTNDARLRRALSPYCRAHTPRSMSLLRARSLVDKYPELADTALGEFARGDVVYATAGVVQWGEGPTFDLTVPGDHEYLVNSVVTHNSGGKTRRAAKMVILDVDHPDIEEFVWCKAREERKARALRDAGFDMDLDGRDSHSIQYQNANNSVRVSDEFMQAVVDDADWKLNAVVTGEAIGEPMKARALMRQISEAAWECADPGMQYDSTINRWHTAPNTSRINASNPCCFTGDTLVLTSEGALRIELLEKLSERGDDLPTVRSFDQGRGEFVESQIIRAWVAGETRNLVEVRTWNGLSLRCTPEHRFLVASDYVEAQALVPGAALVGLTDQSGRVTDYVVEVIRLEEEAPVRVYDLEVEELHNFPVTSEATQVAHSVVVHNSEYMHIDNSACNLASINLLKYLEDDGSFDVEGYKHTIEVMFTAQEILVGNADYPTQKIGENSRRFRQLGLGYANLGALLMAQGLAYDSDEGRAWAGAITALMTGHGYATSARTAGRMGPFAGYAENAEPMLNVLRMHRAAVAEIDEEKVPIDLLGAAQRSWDEAVDVGEVHGVRNSQCSVLAPTGTIGLMMDCDTTGIEPDLALTKAKKLVGGGTMMIVNQTIPRALTKLGYSDEQTEQIVEHIHEHKTILGAPHFKAEHLPIFACSMGDNTIHYMGHVKMMGAAQPFLSGAISKTANVPEETTVEEIEQLYIDSWKLGLKAVAIYRDNCKVAQPLATQKSAAQEADDANPLTQQVERIVETVIVQEPVRQKPPRTRVSKTFSFRVADCHGYATVGEFEDGRPAEIFLKVAKQGSTLAGIMDAFAISVSHGLQYGVPLKAFVDMFTNMRFDPAGMTDDPDIRFATSLVDYLFRRMAVEYLTFEERKELGVMTVAERSEPTLPGVQEAATPDQPAIDLLPPEDRAPSAAHPSMGGGAGATEARVPDVEMVLCHVCGDIMQRAGSCHACPSCGATSGCS